MLFPYALPACYLSALPPHDETFSSCCKFLVVFAIIGCDLVISGQDFMWRRWGLRLVT